MGPEDFSKAVEKARAFAMEVVEVIEDAVKKVREAALEENDAAVCMAMEDYHPFRDVKRNGLVDGLAVGEIGRRKARGYVAELKRKVKDLEKAFRWKKRIAKGASGNILFDKKYGVSIKDVVEANGLCLMVKDTLWTMLNSGK